MWRVVAASVLSLWFVSLGLTATQTDGSQVDLELLMRLLSLPGAEPQLVGVALGHLPDPWPADIPIPEGAEIIGGLVYSDGSVRVRYSLFQSPEEFWPFYEDLLGEAGWTVLAYPMPSKTTVFCRGQEQLMVSASQQGSAVEVLVQYLPAGYPCPRPGEGRRLLPVFRHQVPAISGGSGSGTNWQYERFRFISSEGVAEIEEFYRAQFIEAGWQLVDHGAGDGVAWSRFRKGDQLTACMVVIAGLKGNVRFLFVWAERL